MEIRAKISLAVDSFKQGVKSVTAGYEQVAKSAKATDDYIAKSSRTTGETRRAVAAQSANGEIAEIRKVERAAIESSKRIQSSVKGNSTKLPLAIVQQSSRTTVSPTAGTQGLPERKTAEYRYELEVRISKLRKEADDASRRAAESGLKVALTAAEYKKRGYAAGKPVGMEENVLNLFGKNLAKEQEKLAAVREKYNQKIVADAQKRADKEQSINEKLVNNILRDQARLAKEKAVLANLKSPEFERNLASIRYALYDVGGRAIAFSAGIASAIGSTVKAFADLESSFTSVERVTLGLSSGALQNLRQALIDISTTSPIAFDEVAKIATLGGQMGISADALAGFSQTVAQFSAVTGISADTAAQSFGRLAQMMDIPVSKFENLSSSILYAGVNSVATDQEILSMSESLGSAASAAGMSADQVIGLSTALASLKVRPEEARGVILRLFRTIDVEVSAGGSKLNDYASVLGLVSDKAGTAGQKAADLWKSDPNKFFSSFLKGANSAGDLNNVMQQLGITNTRELNVVSKLANNTDLLAKSMGDARKEYLLGSYASKAFAVANDDLNSKMKMLDAAITEFKAKVGESLAPILGGFLDVFKDIAKFAAAIPAPMKGIAASVGLVAAGMLLLGGGLAVGIAGMLAMKLAIDRMSTSTTGVGINLMTFKLLFTELKADLGVGTALANGFSNSLTRIGFSADAAAFATKGASTAMKGLQASMGWIALAVTAATVIWTMVDINNQAASSVLELGDAMIQAGGGSEALAKAMAADMQTYNETGQAIGDLAVAYSEKDKAAQKSEAIALAGAEATATQIEGIRNSKVSHGELVDAIDVNIASNKKYEDSLKAVDGQLGKTTAKLGTQTAAFILDALAKNKGADGKSNTFFQSILDTKNANVKATAEAFGFNIGKMTEAGLKKSRGATDYLYKINSDIKNLRLAMSQKDPTNTSNAQVLAEYGKQAGWSSEKIQKLQGLLSSGQLFAGIDTGANSLPQFFQDAAVSIDATTKAAQSNTDVVAAQTQAMVDMGYSAEAADQSVGGLGDALLGYVTAAGSVDTANNAAADSFATFVTGINDTTDGLSGSRQDFANWSAFMTAAVNAAIASGTGLTGSVNRMITALAALRHAGKDTKEPFKQLKEFMINAANDKGYTELGDKLRTATDPKQLKGLIQSWINAQTGASKAAVAARAYGVALQGALTLNPDLLTNYLDSFNGITTSAGTAKTALEKLQEQITKTFAAFNARNDLRSSIMALGKSLTENGSNFNTWSEAGQSNTKAVQDAIDKMAVASKGNIRVFGGELKSLRQALINTGNGTPQALSIIDKELKKIGKSGKASKADIAAFTAALKATASAIPAIVSVANSINALTGSVMDYLNARWMLGNTQMQIAAGWEQITGTATKAAEAVADVSAELNKIQADKGILQYQLQVAIKYGDTLRANELRAEIAKLTQDAAKIQADHDKAVADAAAATVSKTPAQDLLSQQQALQQMVSYYVQIGSAQVLGAKNQQDATSAINDTVKSFEDQATAAGVSEENVKTYADELRKGLELAQELNKPVAYKVNAATSDALDKIRAFRDKAIIAINQIPKTVTIKVNTVGAVPSSVTLGVKAATGGLIRGAGSATSDSIPAQLSNGEYVISARAVSAYGVDFMNSLNNMKISAPSIGSQMASAMSGSSMVYLSPEDRSLLRAAIDRPINLYTDNQRIAASANAGNVVLAQRGSN